MYKTKFIRRVWPEVQKILEKNKLSGKKKEWKGFGPYIWSEDGDLKRIITWYCEKAFGFMNVHNESEIDKFMFENFMKEDKDEPGYSIDIDITDALKCKDFTAFRNMKHGLFIEVKQIDKGKSCSKGEKLVEKYKLDCQKLQDQFEKKRCTSAIAILINEGKYKIDKNAFIRERKKDCPDVEVKIWQPA